MRTEIDKINLGDSSLQLPNENLGLGHKAWAHFHEIEDDFDKSTKASFLMGFKTSIFTIIKNFSFDGSILDDVAILLPENQTNISASIGQMISNCCTIE